MFDSLIERGPPVTADWHCSPSIDFGLWERRTSAPHDHTSSERYENTNTLIELTRCSLKTRVPTGSLNITYGISTVHPHLVPSFNQVEDPRIKQILTNGVGSADRRQEAQRAPE